MASRYLSVGELALYLGVCEKWCYQALSKSLIPGAFKIGGRWFIDKEMLEKGLKDLSTKPPTKRPDMPVDDRHNLTN